MGVITLLLWGCARESDPIEEHGEGMPTELRVGLPGAMAAPRAGHEGEVGALWLNTVYLSTIIPTKADKVDVWIKNVAVNNPTVVTVHSGVRDIYTAVNLTDPQMIAKMEGALTKSDMLALEWSMSEMLPEPPFVMSSLIENHMLQAPEGESMLLDVTLKATVARVDLSIEFDARSENFKPGGKYEGWRIELDAVRFSNLPATAPLFETTAIPTYGVRKETNKLPATLKPDPEVTGSWNCSGSFYLPENVFSDRLDMNQASYVTLYARALPPAGTVIEGGDTFLSLVLPIAIGQHAVAGRDFTLRRNKKYTLRIKMVGMDATDRVFINSMVEEWVKEEIEIDNMMGNPSDAIFQDYHLESHVVVWTEDARSIDQMGMPWNYVPDQGNGTVIDGEPWNPGSSDDTSMGEGW